MISIEDLSPLFVVRVFVVGECWLVHFFTTSVAFKCEVHVFNYQLRALLLSMHIERSICRTC